MPLEALREPITPVGLHYLLIHFDIPQVDAAQWELDVGGLVERPLDARARRAARAAGANARRNARVRRERAGAPLAALAQPAVAARGGRDGASGPVRRSRRSCRKPGSRPAQRRSCSPGSTAASRAASSIVYERSLALDDALRDEVLLAYAVNGEPLPPQHGYPLRLIVPGWYGMTHVKWLRTITVVRRGVPRLAAGDGVPDSAVRGRGGNAGDADAAALAARAAGHSGVPVARRGSLDGRAVRARGARLVGLGADRARRGERRRRRDVGRRGARATRCLRTRGAAGASRGTRCRASTSCAAARRDAAGNTQPTEPAWNLDGYCNNAVQRVSVTVS